MVGQLFSAGTAVPSHRHPSQDCSVRVFIVWTVLQCFGCFVNSYALAEDPYSLLDEAKEVFLEQQQIEFPTRTAVRIRFNNEGNSEPRSFILGVAEQGLGCLFARELTDGNTRRFRLILDTPALTAVVLTDKRDRDDVQFSMGELKSGPFTLKYAAPGEETNNAVLLSEMSGYLFNYGSIPFDQALDGWKESGTIDEFTDATDSEVGLHEFKLLDWLPSVVGPVVLHIHPDDYTIIRYEGNFNGRAYLQYMAEEFETLDGIAFPKTVLRRVMNADARPEDWPEGRRSSFRSTWQFVPEELEEFDPEQLSLEFYGLQAPSFTGLRPPKRSYGVFIWSGLAAVAVLGGIVWRMGYSERR